MISAVLACRRSLFDDLGGFDERFVGYGGEDWDLAYRAWNAGAVLVHEPAAVAWHDGPDWAGRPDERDRTALEAARLAELVPEPHTRGGMSPGPVWDVLVDLRPGRPDADRVRRSLLAQSHRDLCVRPSSVEWTADQLRRARVRMEVGAPLPPSAVATVVAELVDRDAGSAVVRIEGRWAATAITTRLAGRSRRWSDRFPPAELSFRSVEIEVGGAAHAAGIGQAVRP